MLGSFWGGVEGLLNLFGFRCCKNAPFLFLKKTLTVRALTGISNNNVADDPNPNWEVSAIKLTFQINFKQNLTSES